MSINVNGGYNPGYYGFDEDLARAIEISSKEQGASSSSSLDDEGFDKAELKRSIQLSLEDQRDDSTFSSQSKRQKSSSSFSITRSADDLITPGVALNRSQKRKAFENAVIKQEPKPTIRIKEISEALHDIVGRIDGIAAIIICYDDDPTNDIVKIVKYENPVSQLVQRLACSVTILDLRKVPASIVDMTKIFENFKKVSVLVLPNWIKGKDLDDLVKFENLQSDLTELYLENASANHTVDNIRSSDLVNLEKFINLKKLNVRYNWSSITDNDIASLARLKTLESLNLHGIGGFTDASFVSIAQLENLQELVLSCLYHIDITDIGFANLANLKKLRSLAIDFSNDMTDVTLGTIAALENLQKLKLTGCYNISDIGLSQLNNLRELSLRRCLQITGAGLSDLKNLLVLDICDCRIEIAKFAELRDLRRLSLIHRDNITDDHLVSISNLRELQELDLSHVFDNSSNYVTDVGLCSLTQLNKLQKLKLEGFGNITDEGLVTLAKLENLKEIVLDDCTKITDAGIARAKEINKTLKIEKNYLKPILTRSLTQINVI